MYLAIIKNYINKLSINDIYNYCKGENINIKEEDAETIFKYIKTYNINILKDPKYYLNDIKNKVNDDIYNYLINFYEKNKKKINSLFN